VKSRGGRRAFLGVCAGSVLFRPALAEEPVRRMIRPAKVVLESRRQVLVVPDSPHRNLRVAGSITSEEHISLLRGLQVSLVVIGSYATRDYAPEILAKAPLFYRMLHHLRFKVDVAPGARHAFETPIIENGIGHPDHPNHGVYYMGYVVTVLSESGELVARNATNRDYIPLAERAHDVPTGHDFPIT